MPRGWLRGDILGNDGAPKRVGDESGEDEHDDVPRFGTLTAEVKSLLLLVSLWVESSTLVLLELYMVGRKRSYVSLLLSWLEMKLSSWLWLD